MDRINFKEWMITNNVSVLDIAKGTDIHPTTIYRFLQGGRTNESTKTALAKFKTEFEQRLKIAG